MYVYERQKIEDLLYFSHIRITYIETFLILFYKPSWKKWLFCIQKKCWTTCMTSALLPKHLLPSLLQSQKQMDVFGCEVRTVWQLVKMLSPKGCNIALCCSHGTWSCILSNNIIQTVSFELPLLLFKSTFSWYLLGQSSFPLWRVCWIDII